MMRNNIWIIGSGAIALEYAKVLEALSLEYIVIGRSKRSAEIFRSKICHDVIEGGIENFLLTKPEIPKKVIVSVGLEELSNVTHLLIEFGAKSILVEKPGFCYPEELAVVKAAADRECSQVYLAYNRRFYSSVLKAEEMIKEDGGIVSFNFEFTEWSHKIDTMQKSGNMLHNWFYANSTHVLDLAFFLGGKPKEMSCYSFGKLDWHQPSRYSGAGVTRNNVLFSYQATWDAPGRWALEVLTRQHRLYFKPMESLLVQELGSIEIKKMDVDNDLDIDFKPGFYLQTKNFLDNKFGRFCTLAEQIESVDHTYKKMRFPDLSS